MFISAPKNAAKPVRIEDEPDPDGDLTEHDQIGEPGLGPIVEERLQEAAVPLIGDRRTAFLRDGDGAGPVPPSASPDRFIHASSVNLCQPASSQEKPRNRRIGSQNR